MPVKEFNQNQKDRIQKLQTLREKAKEILENIPEERKKAQPKERVSSQLRIKAKIPIAISPKMKQKLKQITTEEKPPNVDITIDFTKREDFKGEIDIREKKGKIPKGPRKIIIKSIESATVITAPSVKHEGPLNKDLIKKRMDRIRSKKNNRRGKK